MMNDARPFSVHHSSFTFIICNGSSTLILDALFPSLTRTALDFENFPPPPGDDFWYGPAVGPSTSGVQVTQDSALAVSAVFGCVRLLSTAVATIPQKVYEELGENRKRLAPEHPNYRLLHKRPNVWQVPAEYYELVMVHCLLRGNFFARIVMGGPGRIDQLVPLHPDRVEIEQLSTGRLRFHHHTMGQTPEVFTQDEVHYIRGLSLDGVTGVSVLTYARNAIGLASAQETHGAALFKQGAIPAFYLTAPNKMKPDAKTEFRKNWRGMHGGAENAHNPPVFDDGMEAKPLGISNEDSQWLESRKFQAEEIARFFGVQPHKIQMVASQTFKNIEEENINFVQDTLMPWITKIEQCEERDLFDPDEPFFPEFLVDNRLRGNTLARYQAYKIAIGARIMLPNEARAKENLNPIEGGDEFPEPPGVTGMGAGKGEQKAAEGTEDGEQRGEGRGASSVGRGAFGLLLEDAAARIAAAEIRGLETRAQKAASDHPRWINWVDRFYDGHRMYVLKSLAPLGSAWRCASGRRIDVGAFAALWCEAQLNEMIAAADVPALVELWQKNLAADLTAELKRSFFDAPVPEDS